jgi:hypothetical protein
MAMTGGESLLVMRGGAREDAGGELSALPF